MPDCAPETPVSGDGTAGSAPISGMLLGKDPELLPTPSLSWTRFEDFTERLLSAHRFCPEPLRHVTRVERWGRGGDKQDGIDFEGDFSDGASASWQCKRKKTLAPGDVRAAVGACTFVADVHYLVFSGEASRGARAEMAKHPGWELLDRRGLGRLLSDLPLHKRRDVLDATWGVAVRRRLIEVPGEDAFLSLDTFAADRLDPDTVLNDLGPRVGRESELEALGAALARSGDGPAVVIVTGPGGRGKTRLVVEALTEFQEANRRISVLCLSPGRTVDAAAIAELPHTPAVIVVDDAHQDPAAIAPLLQYARDAEGTLLVLSSRPSGTGALRAQIANARYLMSRVKTIEVGELSRRQARTLVDSLTEGLGLVPAARGYFVGQAVDSPHVAVIAASLIRRGELTAPVVVDTGLREQVLARYEELAAAEVDGVPGARVRRVLAVYAALGPVDDADLRGAVAGFCGLTLVELLRLRQGLQDRGVLVTRGGLTRVIPDVLADNILEGEAAVGSEPTGFAEELWAGFGGAYGQRLFLSLAELDWRLTRRDGPSIISPVWQALRTELCAADLVGLHDALGWLSGLAVTQPHALVEFLDEIRGRLDAADSAGDVDGSRSPIGTSKTDSDGDAEDARHDSGDTAGEGRRWWGSPFGVDDVRQRMPELYGQCAVSAPELLETVLDALWALRRRDTRPTNQNPGHAERVIVERLANLADLPDPSFPVRIVDWVRRWLAGSTVQGGITTPVSVLRPLVAKEGEYHFAESQRRLTFQPIVVSASWARPVRDAIRATLLEQVSGADLRRAAAAVDLLGEALRQPAGLFGRSVSGDEVLAWESDDLATLAALQKVAETATSPVVRRLVRHKIAWTAERATSLRLRHAALSSVTVLDELDDDLAELLLHPRSVGGPTRRGVPVPTLDELRAAAAARAEREAGLTQEERKAAHDARIRDLVEAERVTHDLLVERVVRELTTPDDPSHLVSVLDNMCREIRSAVPDHRLSFWAVWRQLGLMRPTLAPGIVLAIAADAAGPLDESLDQLLNVWAEYDVAGLCDWLTGLAGQRPGVRLAVGTAFATYGWTDRGGRFVDLHRSGTQDPNPEVRDRFLMGSYRLLAADPAGTVADLLAGNISPFATTRALEQACGYDGYSWGRRLDEGEAKAVLRLVSHAGWDDDAIQQLVSGMARPHPRLILDHLLALCRAGTLPGDVDGLAAAFDDESEALIQWLVEQAQRGETADASTVVGLAMKGGPTDAQAQRLDTAVDGLDGSGLLALCALLRDVHTWPLRRPGLARRLLSKARQIGAATAASMRAEIAAAMHLRTWGWVNGVSEELEKARAVAVACAEAETDPHLREDFDNARVNFEKLAAWTLRRNAEDEEE